GVEIHAYCWMSNHFHLVVNCPEGNLSRFMQRFEQQYVLKHNRAIGRRGPLFISRFGAFPIGLEDADADDGGLVVARYVHRNPLDIVPLARLSAYPYSSYGVYLGERPAPDWLRTDVLSDMFGRRTSSLREFTERARPSDRTPAAGRRHEPYLIEQIIAAAALVSGVSVADLLTPTSGTIRRDRALSAVLVDSFRPDSARPPSEVLGVGSRRAFHRLVAKGRALRGSDPAFAEAFDRARSVLWTTVLQPELVAA
ncbi:MAG: hypothetical protein ABJ314_18745, partial [Ilumatobacter sp.]